MRHEDDLDFDVHPEEKDWRIWLPVLVIAILLVIVMGILLLQYRKNSEPEDAPAISMEADTEQIVQITEEMVQQHAEEGGEISNESEDPQHSMAGGMLKDTAGGKGTNVDVADLLLAEGVNELWEKSIGIDVARYQGTIDWKQVASSGIEFAMVRVGYRTQNTGEIFEDSNAKYNMQEAQANGIKIGVYFFSTAVTETEAIEEADWVADYIAQYQITYPVAYNCEGFEDSESRQYFMSQSERTDVADAFLKRIYERGYTPMFYAAKGEMEGDAKWDTSRLRQFYKLWMAWYPSYITPMDAGADAYADGYAMWQYTSNGKVEGIPEPVDVNVAYFAYDEIANAKSNVTPETVSADVEALMKFVEVDEAVTAKEKQIYVIFQVRERTAQ